MLVFHLGGMCPFHPFYLLGFSELVAKLCLPRHSMTVSWGSFKEFVGAIVDQ